MPWQEVIFSPQHPDSNMLLLVCRSLLLLSVQPALFLWQQWHSVDSARWKCRFHLDCRWSHVRSSRRQILVHIVRRSISLLPGWIIGRVQCWSPMEMPDWGYREPVNPVFASPVVHSQYVENFFPEWLPKVTLDICPFLTSSTGRLNNMPLAGPLLG